MKDEKGHKLKHHSVFHCNNIIMKNVHGRKKRVKSGIFTLVELLVVMAIIALLASMLLPSLNNARMSAKGIQCLSNMKQLMTHNLTYLNDWNDYVPITTFADSGSNTNIWSPFYMKMQFAGYIKYRDRLLLCPLLDPGDTAATRTCNYGTAYNVLGYNMSSVMRSANGIGAMPKINQFKTPSKPAAFFDAKINSSGSGCNGEMGSNYYAYYSTPLSYNSFTIRHRPLPINCAFLDGHASNIDIRDISMLFVWFPSSINSVIH